MALRTLTPGVDAGTYQLCVKVQRTISVRIGALGHLTFPVGIYVYTGRAKRALRARVKRHLVAQKKPFWHIDYLLNHPMANIAEIRIVSTDPDEHVEKIRPYIELGFRHLVFHAPGPDQARFIRLYSKKVLPRLRATFN